MKFSRSTLASLFLATLAMPVSLFAAEPAAGQVPAGQGQAKPGQASRPKIEVCFVLDTTGSMGGLIEGAKAKIWSIANDLIRQQPAPEIKFALVPYRDRGDAYVTKVYDLTDDIDTVYKNLQTFRAEGGGDEPEDVNQALDDAVNKVNWSGERGTLKIIFLVGDAPPHMDYGNEKQYPQICQEAVRKDLLINTVQCGTIVSTGPVWKEIARKGEGAYVALEQSGGMVVRETPQDKELVKLNEELNKTIIPYGQAGQQAEVRAKAMNASAAPASVAADRAVYNLRDGGKVVQGKGELANDLASGQIKLDEVAKDQLSPEMQKMSPEERKAYVSKQLEVRGRLQAKIADVTKQREAYMQDQRKQAAASARDSSGAGAAKPDSFDEKVSEIVKQEAAAKK